MTNGEFKIEKGVPLTPAYSTPMRRAWPFANMAVDDSVFCEPPEGMNIRAWRTRCMTGARYYARTEGKKFVSRREGNGVRIWRVS